ncbi:M28 family metallopeptidase [Limnochorda pilosa]|uniref:Peptidase M28 domain-containing protein n=1 Tax=Limnochorda pilosa TaxID=1555112 RepID=A0A0K2SKX6_LIMPI|nr:M28 family peptidase [Limnochorda pilosa]BAS27771.1 hypothetical protein LIP_1930 [Limnochorda pilosa]
MPAWDHLRELTTRFDHRTSTSGNERAASVWIEERLRGWGYEVLRHPFRAPRETLYTGPPVVGLAVFVLALAAERVPAAWGWAAFAGSLVALVPLMGELLGSGPNLDRVLPLRPSQSVEAIRPALGEARRTLVITAHYDTQRASLLFAPGFAPFVRPFLTLGYAALLGTPLAMLLRLLLPGAGWVRVVLGVLLALLAITMGFLLICKATARDINGANDNGSGTAVALALAERMAGAGRPEGAKAGKAGASGAEEERDAAIPVPAEVEVRFLFTGCEEVGLRGMAAWMDGRGRSLPPGSPFVNLDNLGGGILRYQMAEGMLVPFPSDRTLVEQAAEVAREMEAERGRTVLTAWSPLHYLPTDGLIPLRRGFPTLTFIGRDEAGQIPNYHWTSDTLSGLGPDHLDEVEEAVARFVGRLLARAVTGPRSSPGPLPPPGRARSRPRAGSPPGRR